MYGLDRMGPVDLWRRLPLIAQLALLGALAGVLLWGAAEWYAGGAARALAHADREARLRRSLASDTLRFSARLRTLAAAAELFAERGALQERVGGGDWSRSVRGTPEMFRGVPPRWFPARTALAALAGGADVLLLGPQGAVREVYEEGDHAPAPGLYPAAVRFAAAGRYAGLVTLPGGRAFVLAADPVTDPQGRARGALVLAVPAGAFLQGVDAGTEAGGGVLALVSGDGSRVLASSDPRRLAPGASPARLGRHWLARLSPPGAVDGAPAVRLLRAAPVRPTASPLAALLARERERRVLTASGFVLVFVLLMGWVTYRVRALSGRITEFARRMGLQRGFEGLGRGGDEIARLERGFQGLMEHVLDETSSLEHQTQHDALTRLPNRVLLYDRLEQAVLSGARDRRVFALMMMDLDRFKEINDTLGHPVGDQMLKQVGERLLAQLRNTDTVARLGGDEFAVLLPGASAGDAVNLARKISATIERPFLVEGHNLSVGISMGIVHFPTHGTDANTLLQRADVAMYQAKRYGGGHAVYDPGQDEHSIERIALMNDLREAIENHSLELYFQPEYDMNTGRVCRAEALLRWSHPRFGPISPDEFIHIAERTGMIASLTDWVLDGALHQCARWVEEGLDMEVSVNLSVRNLQDPDLPRTLGERLQRWQVEPRRLMVEITESAIMSDPASVRENLLQLNAMGVRACIDDFGTGYSSLVYLKELPLQEVKIDRAFVMDMVRDDNDAVIVRATIDLAHNLGLGVVAEGVETREVWELLEILGCDLAQGNYLGIPLPAQDFIGWLQIARLNPLVSNLIRARTHAER